MRASNSLRKISSPEIIPDWVETPLCSNPAVLPERLIKPFRRQNPHIDSFQPFTRTNNLFEAGVDRVAQRQANALLAHDESTQERRTKSILNSEVLKDLNKLGVSLTGDVDRGYCLVGNKTGRKLHIPDDCIRYAMTRLRNVSNENFECRDIDHGRIRTIEKMLRRANTQRSTPVSLDQLCDRYFLLGGNPAWVAQHFAPEIRSTVSTIAKELQVPLRDVSKIKKPKILLYTTIGGGGHLAHARAIDQYLKMLGIETVIMNNDANVFDPLAYLTDGEASQFDAYNRVFQRRIGLDGRTLGSDKEVREEFLKYDHIHDVLHALTGAKNHFEIARHELRDPNYVALIDNLPHLTGIEGAAISNGLRYVRWATDFDAWVPLLRSYDVMDADRGKIALTSSDPVANRELSPEHRRQGDIWKKEILKSDSDIEVKPEILEDPRLLVAGYPIRQGINKLSFDERNALRSRMGLAPPDQLIVVMMGSQGKYELMEVMQQLLERPPINIKGKVNVTFAVGANVLLKKDLMNLVLQNINRKMEVRMADELLGTPNQLLNATQMNVLYNTADLLISKPGGSVTAEILETETPIIMCALNRGEEGNASYLLRSGLGFMRDNNISLGEQAEAILQGKKLRFNPKFKLPDWRISTKTMLEEFIGIKIAANCQKPSPTALDTNHTA
jgi:UDP-N-acetylglucosamine:LPS N-acetylglucosamine transferase